MGVVGLGAMGAPVCRFLLGAGFEVLCLDRDASAASALSEQGARRVDELPDLAAACGVVLLFVPSDQDVVRVCTGETGILAGARPGCTLVICSSVRPTTCHQVAAAARDSGVEVLDAALTGGARGAEAGQVTLLVGGDEDALERIDPVLAPWTRSVHHLGGLGSGQVGKTVNNLCHWAQISAIYEALTLGLRLGVAPSRLRGALMDGPADSRTLRELQHMRLTWHAKDLANALAIAQEVGLAMPMAERVREVMPGITVERVAALLGDDDPDAAGP